MTQNVLYEFGPFRLDSDKRILLRDDKPVSLTPKAFDMLLLLVEHAGRIIPKEELMAALWPNSHVEEANLTQTVFMLRKALGGASSDGRHIVTIPGRGYRFTADVKETARNLPIPPEAVDAPASEPWFNRPHLRLWAITLTGAMLLLAGLLVFRSSHSPARPITSASTTLAVLPFENLTGDTTQDYFSEGLTEELTVQLAHSDPQHLKVIASTPAAGDHPVADRLQRIERDLNVQYVLEGSVRRDSNHIRASAKLIRMPEQTYVWTKQYDRELTNLLAMESDVARDIAAEIRSALGGNHQSPKPALASASPTNFAAYDLYLKGRYFWNKRTSQALLQAVQYFNRATQQDPHYARAYAGLADSYALYSGYSATLPQETMPKARAAADRALALDPNLAEAHASSAVIAQDYDWDWSKAEREYRQAIALDPSYATAHQWYAEFLALQGRFNEAFAEMERARKLDPLSLIIASDNAVILYYARQYDRSIAQFRSVLEMEPQFPRAHMLIFVYAQKRMLNEAVSAIQQCCDSEDSLERWSFLAYVYGLTKQTDEARAAISKLEQFRRDPKSDIQYLLLAHAAIGDKDSAFTLLDELISERSSNLTNLKVGPMYDPLRGDPRFHHALQVMKLAP